MAERVIRIGDKDVPFKATASTPRRYRERFNSDLFADINRIIPKSGALTFEDLGCVENMIYIMAKQADPTIPDDPDEWLDSFEMMPFYEIFPQVLELWGLNVETLETPKKKVNRQSAH